MSSSPWLDDALWKTIQQSVPIVCVDVVPVRRDDLGFVSHVGLIRRLEFLDQVVWCHVGGRVRLGESVRETLVRHVCETLGRDVSAQVGPDPQPTWVQQYFCSPRPDVPGAGHDPRKHALGLSFLVDLPVDVDVVDGGEGLEFQWFTVQDLPAASEMWPGSKVMVLGLLRQDRS